MFCREVCEIIVERRSDQIGGPGKQVQIDESKIGKHKYHKGHYVEGQWVFGGIEEDSRKCFVVTVEDRSEKTLLPLIKKWISPGSIIISDCWKSYINLDKNGYIHKTVNHSQEFVNENGDHTNKIEGHWRQMKSSLPTHGRRKYHYSSYLAEFIWRYINKDEDLFWVFLNDVKAIYNPVH
jgi:transposase-like protein